MNSGCCGYHWRTFHLILASPCQNVSADSRRACVHLRVRDDLVTCAQCNLILLTQGLAVLLHTRI